MCRWLPQSITFVIQVTLAVLRRARLRWRRVRETADAAYVSTTILFKFPPNLIRYLGNP
jgi:hypothetical protein